MKYCLTLLYFFIFITPVVSQSLLPGFDKQEYISLMRINAVQAGFFEVAEDADSGRYKRIYSSPEMGLQNQWELWTNGNGIGVISIRATSHDYVSWLANFYAAMVPANGSLKLEKNYRFDYHLADDPKAAVHTGWLVGTAMLVRDMIPWIDSMYYAGVKDFLIVGHSQGGAIAYLITSHLHWLQSEGKLPTDIVTKTYCSAAPKPGNLYYAYAFEAMTSDGWAYNVVNAADWVPEMPVSVQTTTDYNKVNLFVNAESMINKQKFVQRVILKKAYKRLSGAPRKSQEEYTRYLGDKIFIFIKQVMPEFEKPVYVESINYVRAGKTIVLLPDESYYAAFPDDLKNIFRHHLFEPYFFLINRYEVKLNSRLN